MTAVPDARTEGTTPVGEARERATVTVAGRIVRTEVSPLDGPARLVAAVNDGTGVVEIVFMGRRLIPGIRPGQRLAAHGRVVSEDGVLRIHNPRYDLEGSA